MLTVAVIEEDVPMRALICEWLQTAGYEIRWAGAPADCAAVDLVIIDIPNLRSEGELTVGALRASCPRAAMIGMSTQLGRSLPGNSALAVALGVGRLIAKPLDRDELLDAVVGAIGRPPLT